MKTLSTPDLSVCREGYSTQLIRGYQYRKDSDLFGFLLLGVDYRILCLGQAIIPHFERGGVDDLDIALIFAVHYFAIRSVFKE